MLIVLVEREGEALSPYLRFPLYSYNPIILGLSKALIDKGFWFFWYFPQDSDKIPVIICLIRNQASNQFNKGNYSPETNKPAEAGQS